MKLKFKNQTFQTDAVNAAAELFKGQRAAQGAFSVTLRDYFNQAADGYGNVLNIDRAQVQANMRAVQERNALPLSDIDGRDGEPELRFNIEMETGTGKTFVYIKTIYELNKLYGFSKFVILVPSVAIREGTFHSFGVTESHFAAEYQGTRAHYFIYNSKKLNEVRDFATSPTLEVMIVTIDAVNKDANLFNQESDKMDRTGREFMQSVRPILIIDEPQSIDTTPKSRAAIKNLNPLFELRYSATHKEKINTIYRLTPVDAYGLHIVKQICIASDSIEGGHNKPYVKLLEAGKKNGYFARLELDCHNPKTGLVERVIKTTGANADLAALTGRELYQGCEIVGIDCTPGFESIEFSNGDTLEAGKSIGDADEMLFKREQIRSTIQIHLEKELRYLSRGIKVLSLFFIDEVAKYRVHGADGEGGKGVYARIFEEEYAALTALPKFAKIRETFPQDAAAVHNGYFSKDKTGALKDTKGDTSDDYNTYNLIMKQKEELLSFSSPLRFIFSHSALKEEWDNPNVFQICTLIENKTPFTCRQKIGRGLRLCVNQDGERIEDKNINVLHVISNEGFAEFAAKLQTEIEELGVKFGVVDIGMFVNIAYGETRNENGEMRNAVITHSDAVEIVEHFRARGYVDGKGKMKDTLKVALATGTVNLPARLEKARERIEGVLRAADKKVTIKPYKKEVAVKRRDEAFNSAEFEAIWDKMKQKTIFRMAMNMATLDAVCVKKIREMPPIPPVKIRKEVARLDIEKSGVSFEGIRNYTVETDEEFLLPDIIAVVAADVKMPKLQVGKILLDAERHADFVNNPQSFAEAVTAIIKSVKIDVMMDDGIKYSRANGREYSWYEVFNLDNETELKAYLEYNAVAVDERKTIYDHVVYDSATESAFAEALNADNDVKLFFKIPPRFRIPTPVGAYNPDWAVYYETPDGTKKLYFIIETKGTLDTHGLQGYENFRNLCGKKHFAAAGSGLNYQVAVGWSGVKK